MSSKSGSDCILSAVCTEHRPWIALCPLRGRANQSLIPLHPSLVRVTSTMQWQQPNTPADPGVRSLRNHSEPSFTRTIKGFPQAYQKLWQNLRKHAWWWLHTASCFSLWWGNSYTWGGFGKKKSKSCATCYIWDCQTQPYYNLSLLNMPAMIPHTWKRNLCQISSCCDSSSKFDNLLCGIVPLLRQPHWVGDTGRQCPWHNPLAWARVAQVGVGGNLRWLTLAIPWQCCPGDRSGPDLSWRIFHYCSSHWQLPSSTMTWLSYIH